MSSRWKYWCWQLGASSLVLGSVIAASRDYALAQITPDGTLGAESSVVNQAPGSTADEISGGATRGANLFHSFEQFSVLNGREAHFNNAADIQNIISRVTGGSVSSIEGLLRAEGTANLFLLNPNGIIFGPNASLNIGGSFVGSTANAIQFAEQGFFSASAPDAPPLLSVNPSAFLFNQITAASIENRSRAYAGRDPSDSFNTFGLRVPDGRSLLLVGGDLKADGGGIVAFGGRVDLAAVAGLGTVGLNLDDKNLSLSVPDSVPRANVSLTNEAGFIVAAGGGGNIAITAKNIDILSESGLFAGMLSNLGSEDAQAGDITLNATGAVSLDNSSDILNSVFSAAVGNSGNINITAGSLFVKNAARIRSQTSGRGNAGNITIVARDTVSFDGRDSTDRFPSAAFASVEPGAVGDGGNINITTGSLSITNRAQLLSNTESIGNAGSIFVEARDQVSLSNSIIISEVSVEGGVGNGGDISIKTGSLLLRDGSSLLADAENRGNAGNITIEARDAVILEGIGPAAQSRSSIVGFIVPSQITATVESQAVGNGGNINISAGSLSVTDEGFISANTFGKGDAGSIIVTTGNLSATNGARISARTSGSGNARNLTIAAERLSIRDGAQVSVSTSGTGNAGNLTVVDADLVEIVGTDAEGTASGLFAQANSGASGIGGNLTIETRQLNVRDKAQVAVSSEGTGSAGKLEVVADSIRLENLALLSSETTAEEGNIFLRSEDLVLRRGSSITTNAIGTATGGNITIDTGALAALENSDISANALQGPGGRVRINAQGIFGTEFRNQRTPESDITATSDLGSQFSGTVEINNPDVDPTQGLVALPAELVDASNQIAQGCAAGEGPTASEFIITGRGGIPPNPNEPLSGEAVMTEWATLEPGVENRSGAASATNPIRVTAPPQIVEAQGWVIGPKGEVILTASAPTGTPHSLELTSTSCHGS
jgi:filamentous hemagglutinin family protein